MTARIRPDFVGPECHNVDAHDGIRHTLAEIKQHLVDVHGFVYDETPMPDSTDEEIIDMLLPVEELRAEVEQLEAEVIAEHELNRKAMAEVERLKEQLETTTKAYIGCCALVTNAEAEIERLRAALLEARSIFMNMRPVGSQQIDQISAGIAACQT